MTGPTSPATLRAARPEEAAAISALALRSKAHWGYDEAFLAACRAELTWTAAQCGSGDVARLQSLRQRLFDDQLAAGAVDNADALLHDGQRGRIDQALGLRSQADVQGEVVGPAEDLIDGNERHVVLAGDDRRDEGIVADQLHAEGAGAACDLKADAAEADDAEGFAAQLAALQGLLLPLAFMHGRVGARNGPGHRDHQAQR